MPHPTDILYFPHRSILREWFSKHHADTSEAWIGFYKKDSGKGGITYDDAVEEALCFGWIDGIRKAVDAFSYTNRFTPRKSTSTWSETNLRRIKKLRRLGLMMPSGEKIYLERNKKNSGRYSFEQERHPKLPPAYLKQFKGEPEAWKFFSGQPPWYQRTALWWIVSAKQKTTREKRLTELIVCSRRHETIPPLTRKKKPGL
jgi:uncharacterized protein YdeI (YjbR/CyaY-like superfamily)